jgi:hypothetical protein
MINNQFSRRNLSTVNRLELAYKFEAEKAKIRQLSTLKQFTDSAPVHIRKEEISGRALEVVAKMAGVSARTADQYDKIQTKGTNEQKEEVASGNSSIKKVYTQIQRAERLANNTIAEWPKGKYRFIYAYPSLILLIFTSFTSFKRAEAKDCTNHYKCLYLSGTQRKNNRQEKG